MLWRQTVGGVGRSCFTFGTHLGPSPIFYTVFHPASFDLSAPQPHSLRIFPHATVNYCARRTFCTLKNEAPSPPPPEKSEETVERPPEKKSDWRDPFNLSWPVVLVTFTVGGGLIAAMLYVKKQLLQEQEKQRTTKTYGKALIGGPWKLVDHNGIPRSREDYLGDWYMIYFGFTHCPDVCPEQIERMLKIKSKIDAVGHLPNIHAFVFSVDPARDTPQNMKKYLSEFSPDLLGFTGTREQVDKIMKMFRVYASAGPVDDDNDYIVDHSVTIYVIDPVGEFYEYFGADKTADFAAGTIMMQMAKKENEKRKRQKEAEQNVAK